MEVYLKTNLDLDALGRAISKLLNVAERNPTSYQVEQRRHSENRGGTYYLFEVLGLELLLLQNAAEAAIPERPDWPFYLLVGVQGAKRELAGQLCKHLAELLRREGYSAEVDGLAA